MTVLLIEIFYQPIPIAGLFRAQNTFKSLLFVIPDRAKLDSGFGAAAAPRNDQE
jgi:hypothetical protein